MSINTHTISQIGGSNFNNSDRVHMGKVAVAYIAGASAGAAVVTAVSMEVPPNALVIPAGVSATYADVSAVTSTGFTLTLTPRNSGTTLAAGTAGVFIIA